MSSWRTQGSFVLDQDPMVESRNAIEQANRQGIQSPDQTLPVPGQRTVADDVPGMPGLMDTIPQSRTTGSWKERGGFTLDDNNAPSETTAPEEKSFGQRVSDDIAARVDKVRQAPDLPNYLISSARLGVGPVSDVIVEGLKSGYRQLPTGVRTTVEDVAGRLGRKVGSIPLTKEGVTVGDVAAAVPEFSENNPTLANALGYVSELPAVPGVKAVGKISEGLALGGRALEASAQAGRTADLQSLVLPLMNKREAAEAALRGRTKVSGRIFKTKEIVPYEIEKRAAQEVSKIPGVTSGNTISNILTPRAQQNIGLIEKEIGEEGTRLSSALKKENVSILSEPTTATLTSKDDFGGVITGETITKPGRNKFLDVIDETVAEIDPLQTMSGDAQKQFSRMVGKMRELVESNDSTTAGLLEARKGFDRWVLKNKPKIFDQNYETAASYASDIMRRRANDFIAENTKSIDVKNSLSKQNALYVAAENMAPRAAAEGATVGQRLRNAVTDKGNIRDTLGLAALGGAGAFLSIPATLSAGAGYGLYKAGTSDAAKYALGKVLQAPEDISDLLKGTRK